VTVLLATMLFVIGLTALGGGAAGRTRAPVVLGTTIDEHPQRIALPAQGGRPTVVAFFASWCGRCAGELRHLQGFHEYLGSQVAFVGVDFSDQGSAGARLLREARVTFPAVSDRSGTIARKFGVVGVPAVVFVDAAGRIAERDHRPLVDWKFAAKLYRHFGVPAPAVVNP
jgi:thiol-disulfide isomerase/thioredoxin